MAEQGTTGGKVADPNDSTPVLIFALAMALSIGGVKAIIDKIMPPEPQAGHAQVHQRALDKPDPTVTAAVDWLGTLFGKRPAASETDKPGQSR